MSNAKVQLLIDHKAISQGSYMFIANTNVRKFGLPDFENFYFCSNSKNGNSDGMHNIAKAYNMLQAYFAAEELQARVHFVCALQKDNRKIHACVIGPLQLLTEGELMKMEHFVENTIPTITSNMVGWQELLEGAGWKEMLKSACSQSKSARMHDYVSSLRTLAQNKQTMSEGWYMFIVDANIHEVGLPDFENFYFATKSKSDRNESMLKMAKAYNMLQQYVAAEGLQAHVHFAYALQNDKKKVYACVIDPLQLLEEQQINKMQNFVENRIPGITSNMVGYQLKYTALNHSSHDHLRAVSKMTNNKQRFTDDATSVLHHLLRSGYLL